MSNFFQPNASGSSASASNLPFQIENAGLACSVATSALTIALKQLDGSSDPSINESKVVIGFRSATLTSAATDLVEITSALSVTIPSGATLGHRDGVAGYIYVYAVNNSGTVSLAVSSQPVNENQLQSVTAIGVGSDTYGTLYGTVLTSKPVRLLARLVSTQTTAGTWDAVPTEASMLSPGFQAYGPLITNWEAFTPTGAWSTNTTYTGMKRRVGDTLEVITKIVLSGAPTSAALTFTIPDSLTIDTTKLVAGTGVFPVGQLGILDSGTTNYAGIVSYGSTTTVIAKYFNDTSTEESPQSVTQAAPITFASGDEIWCRYSVPISGWSA